MYKYLCCNLLMLALSLPAWSQHENVEYERQKGKWEIITSGIYAHSFEHEEGSFGTEIHLTYWFNHIWGTGLSYTAKFEEETLNDIAVLASCNPTSWMTLNVGPNFGLSGKHREFEVAAYAEAEINIRPTEGFHFGPVIGTIIGKNWELSTGIHIGFEF